MKRITDYVIRLYPKAWRARYGNELEALLEDVKPKAGDLADVAWEAIGMRFMQLAFWKPLVAFGTVGLVIAAITALTMPDRYISKAVMRVSGSGDILAEPERQVLSRSSLRSIMMSYGLYTEERATQPLEEIVDRMRKRDIQILAMRVKGPKPDIPGLAVQVSFRNEDPSKAKAVAEELVGRFQEELLRSGTPNFEVLDRANLPLRPFYPNRPLICLLGVVCGAIAGLGLAGALAFSRRRLNHA